ncbi:acetate--CoA ligase family protein [Chloroflexota bacterium]
MNEEKLGRLEPVFYPKSIAVIGASPDERKYGSGYLHALVLSGYQGGIYAVNRVSGTCHGVHIYPSLNSIPNPVDFVIVAVPVASVLEVLDDCAAKGVKVVQFFTAGFRETGSEAGRSLETEMAKRAQQGGFRIIGPNCIGVYNPAVKIPYGQMEMVGEAGSVAFISQSGGHGGRLIGIGLDRGIKFSKVVSFGNACDLDCVDYLEYLAVDPQTKLIGAYLEGIQRGKRFLELVRETVATKPLIVWKGGRTETGAEAAASHTGSLASSYAVWKAALEQAGALTVESLEEMVDTIIALEHMGASAGRRVAIVSGLTGGGGGDSVSSTDTFVSIGLEVPRFTSSTLSILETLLPSVGSILRNPLDIGSVGANLDTLRRTMDLVFADPGIDVVIVQQHIDMLLHSLSLEQVHAINDVFIETWQAQSKPLAVVSPAWAAVTEGLEVESKLQSNHIPVYRNLEGAARGIANTVRYNERLKASTIA